MLGMRARKPFGILDVIPKECIMNLLKKIKKPSSFQTILLGFAGVILIGALLLMLPISSTSGEVTPFLNALFTSTSATCVTGLIVYDTATHWSIFGQIIILLLIQTGGMGVITIALAFSMLAGKKIGLMQRSMMQEAVSAHNIGGIVRYTGFIIKGIFAIELIGALAMMPVFCSDFGPRGIWMSVFHSVSAFCNAGFDILGSEGAEFVSLTAYSANPVISLTVVFLILIGGIGFLTWDDVCKNKWHLGKYRLQSKIILITTAVIVIIPTLYFFFFEFETYSMGERFLLSLFQSVTPRTAGFNTANLNLISEVGIFLMIILMMIGGSAGSTAGGMKMTTIAVLISSAFSVFRKKNDVELAKRRISDETVKHAAAVFFLYISLLFIGAVVICLLEELPLLTCLYETASAVATVGLSLGITPTLCIASKLILIMLMFVGRIGVFTLVYATFGSTNSNHSKYPLEKIAIG